MSELYNNPEEDLAMIRIFNSVKESWKEYAKKTDSFEAAMKEIQSVNGIYTSDFIDVDFNGDIISLLGEVLAPSATIGLQDFFEKKWLKI